MRVRVRLIAQHCPTQARRGSPIDRNRIIGIDTSLDLSISQIQISISYKFNLRPAILCGKSAAGNDFLLTRAKPRKGF